MKKVVFGLPTLYGEASTGKTKVYSVSVVDNEDGTFSIMRQHGQLNGKMQIDEKVVSVGKNIGKKNETSPKDQAISEAKSMWQKKIDSNYQEDFVPEHGSKKNLLPMLAKSYKDDGHRIKFPAYAQPKLNGVRCLAQRNGDTITFTSRKGKSYNDTLQHLVPSLLDIMKDCDVFDGEIYVHGLPLQTIASLVKKCTDDSRMLQYWMYDVVDESKGFGDRTTYLASKYDGKLLNSNLVHVETVPVWSDDDVKKLHNFYVSEGYEGVMIRNSSGGYETDHRSANLQKYKEFKDDEFKILGGRTPDTGRYAGCCVFLCDAGNGKTFECCPRGTVEVRKQYYRDLSKLIGKNLTVRYQEKSIDGVPIFPIGICVRDYEN